MKYYLFNGQPGWTAFSIIEFDDYDLMIEAVRKFQESYDFLPNVYYGQKLEFEPAEIVKSWKVKSESKP